MYSTFTVKGTRETHYFVNYPAVIIAAAAVQINHNLKVPLT